MARDIFNGSTGNRVRVIILDDAGIGKTGVAHNAASLVIGYRIDTGSAVTITLTSSNWTEIGGGNYLVDVADSVYASGNLGKLVTFYGSLPSSTVVAEQHRVTAANYGAVAYGANTTTPPTTATIADTTLSSLTSGPSTGGSWPNGSFGRRVLVGSSTQREVAVTGSHHVAADVHEFQPDVIDSDAIATSAITEIAGGVWSAASSAYSAATGTMGLIVYAFSQMLELVTGVWRWKATSLSQAPAGGGDGIYAITLVAASSGGNVPGTTFSIVGTVTNVTTNSGGTAVLNLNAGTYTLRTTTPPGYQSVADSSLVVSADATVTKTLVATSYAPTTAPGCTVTIPVRSQYTTALAGVDVKIKFIGWETGATKPATILSPPPIQASDANGLVSVILYRQARYTATYTVEGDTTKVVAFTTPNAGSYVVIEG
jgi:hypothetical protein